MSKHADRKSSGHLTRQGGDQARHQEKPSLPGEAGIWVFIFGDMLVFAIFFGTFLYYRNLDLDVFEVSRGALNENFGLANTLILLTSSWLVVWGVDEARFGRLKGAFIRMAMAMALGGGFVGLKALEWREKFAAGISVVTNDFFMFYFIFTGIHLGHVLIGLGALAFASRALQKVTIGAGEVRTLESAAAFWHFVDLLWVILFALLYLIR